MGLFGKIFDKKECSICGGEIETDHFNVYIDETKGQFAISNGFGIDVNPDIDEHERRRIMEMENLGNQIVAALTGREYQPQMNEMYGNMYSRKMNKYIKRVMLFCVSGIVSMLDVANVLADDVPYYDSHKAFQIYLDEIGSICGVIYIGEVDGSIGTLAEDEAYLEELLYKYTSDENYEFLWNISEDRIIEIEGGTELYCIVPANVNYPVAVNKYCLNYESLELELHNILYRSDYGDPFFVRCNASEMYRDAEVVVVDDKGEILSWNPGRSFVDGRLEIPEEGPYLYDGTWYEENFYDGIEIYDTDVHNIEETTSFWEVVNCNEWVSLREKPDVTSVRLAEVPLGTIVIDNGEYENGFTAVNFAGIDGYIHADYLMYYEGGNYAEPCGGDIYYEEVAGTGNTYPLLMTLDEITSWGYEILNFENGKFRVCASIDNDMEGDLLKVGCFYDEKPVWGYVSEYLYDSELQITDAFMAGTEEEPAVCIFNAAYGVTQVDLLSGDILWEISSEDIGIGASLSHVVGDDGTIYCAGYYDDGPTVISVNGEYLWRNGAANPDIYYICDIRLEGGKVIVDYVTGTEDGNDIVAFDMITGNLLWKDIRSYY